MTIEERIQSKKNAVEKAEKNVTRCEGLLSKKVAKNQQKNYPISKEEWNAYRETHTDEEASWMFWEYNEVLTAEQNLSDAQKKLATLTKELQKLTGEAEAKAEQQQEEEKILKIERHFLSKEERRAQYEAWLAEFKRQMAEYGIEIEEANANVVWGRTSKGETFIFSINYGYTERSLHCYTLKVNGAMLFSSGDWSTCIKELARR